MIIHGLVGIRIFYLPYLNIHYYQIMLSFSHSARYSKSLFFVNALAICFYSWAQDLLVNIPAYKYVLQMAQMLWNWFLGIMSLVKFFRLACPPSYY